jgi:hypothetical protein
VADVYLSIVVPHVHVFAPYVSVLCQEDLKIRLDLDACVQRHFMYSI